MGNTMESDDSQKDREIQKKKSGGCCPVFVYLEKSQHANGNDWREHRYGSGERPRLVMSWSSQSGKTLICVRRNCPKNNHPLLFETVQKKHLTNNICVWQDMRTKTASIPLRKALVNCLSLCLLRISIFFPISHMLGGGKVSEGFCQVPVISGVLLLLLFCIDLPGCF